MSSDDLKSNNFSKLVKDITDKERNELLGKLQKYTYDDLESGKGSDVRRSERNKRKEIEKYSQNVYKKMSLINKIITVIKSFFSGQPIEDIVIENEFNDIKKNIKIQNPKLVDFAQHKLTSTFIKKIIPLIKEINIISEGIDSAINETVFYYEFLVYVVEKVKSDELQELMKIISPYDIDESTNVMDKKVYDNEKEKRIKRFFSKLSTQINFDDISREFLHFELLRKLLQFDYNGLLRMFFIYDVEQTLGEKNFAIITDNVISSIERFYRIISSLSFDFESSLILKDFFDYLEKFPIHIKDINDTADYNQYYNSILKLSSIIKEINKEIPFEEIFKYAYKNVLYRTRIIKFNFNVYDLYRAYKTKIIEKLWDNSYQQLRKNRIESIVHEIFGKYNFDSLHYFKKDVKMRIEKYAKTPLNDYYVINFILKFITMHYKGKIEVALNKILINGNFKKETEKQKLSASYYLLNSAEERILNFDRKFSEEHSFMKKIISTIRRIGGDPNYKTPLINIVNDINNETNTITNELIDAIKNTKDILAKISSPDQSDWRLVSNFSAIKIPGFTNSLIALEKYVKILEKVLDVYKLIKDVF